MRTANISENTALRRRSDISEIAPTGSLTQSWLLASAQCLAHWAVRLLRFFIDFVGLNLTTNPALVIVMVVRRVRRMKRRRLGQLQASCHAPTFYTVARIDSFSPPWVVCPRKWLDKS